MGSTWAGKYNSSHELGKVGTDLAVAMEKRESALTRLAVDASKMLTGCKSYPFRLADSGAKVKLTMQISDNSRQDEKVVE